MSKGNTAIRLTLKSKEMVMKCAIQSVIFIAVSFLFGMVAVELFQVAQEKQADYQQYQVLSNKAAEKEQSVALLKESLSQYPTVDRLITQKEFVDFAGNICDRNQLKLNKMTGGTLAAEEDAARIQFQIEVQGKPEGMRTFLESLSTLPSLLTVKQVSYRRADDFTWLYRNIDEDKILTWWDMSNQENSSKKARDTKNLEEAQEDKPIGTAQMLEDGELVVYLELEFVKAA